MTSIVHKKEKYFLCRILRIYLDDMEYIWEVFFMENYKVAKDRLLFMHSRLIEGKVLYKEEEAERFGCSLRSIQRDIDDLRSFFHNQSEDSGIVQELIYDRKLKGYRLVPPVRNVLRNDEVFAVLKILLESRAFTKEELYPILDKLVDCCVPREKQRQVNDLIGNEKLHYVEPQHKNAFLAKMWELSEAVKERRQIIINYRRAVLDDKVVTRTLQPVGIMFSEYYFYLVGFIVPKDNECIKYKVENDPFPTIYRIDRIQDYIVTDEHFNVPYQNRFEEGEFRKRVQFMYGGKLQKIKFYYKGPNIEAVLDRLPTAKILQQDDKGLLIAAEVFGAGIEMWIRSQGEMVEVVKESL